MSRADGRLYYAFDFDGTVVQHDFPRIGKPRRRVIELMRRIRFNGDCIIIWTCRSGQYEEEMIAYLTKAGIPFDYVNENPEVDYGSRKLFAHYYIDDRAVELRGVDDLMERVKERGRKKSAGEH